MQLRITYFKDIDFEDLKDNILDIIGCYEDRIDFSELNESNTLRLRYSLLRGDSYNSITLEDIQDFIDKNTWIFAEHMQGSEDLVTVEGLELC